MRPVLLALLVLLSWCPAPAQITDDDIDQYLVETLDHALSTQDDALDRWKARYSDLAGTNIVQELIGYQPPNFLALTAEIAAHLYADAARKAPNLAERDHQTRQAARLNQALRRHR